MSSPYIKENSTFQNNSSMPNSKDNDSAVNQQTTIDQSVKQPITTTSPSNNAPVIVSLKDMAADLRKKGIYADVKTDITKQTNSFEDELMESPMQKCIYIQKHKIDTVAETDTVYYNQYNPYTNTTNFATYFSEMKCPKNKTHLSNKLFAFFIITEATKVFYFNKKEGFDVWLKCDSMNGRFEVLIPADDFENKKISRHIEKAAISVCNVPLTTSLSKGMINNYLFKHISNKLAYSGLTYRLATKPGFYLCKDDNNNNRWIFVYDSDKSLPMPNAVKKAHFEEYEYDADTARRIISEYLKIVGKYKVEFLAFLRLCALLYTPIANSFKLKPDDIKAVFKKVVVFYGCDSDDKKNALSTWLKVYNRDGSGGSPIHKLSSLKKSQIKSVVDECKDCFVIFEDNSASAKGTTKISASEYEKMEYIADLFVKNKGNANDDVECLCAVISDRYMMQGRLSDECFLFFDVSDLKVAELDIINDVCYAFDQIIVDYVKHGFAIYPYKNKHINEVALSILNYKYTSSMYTLRIAPFIKKILNDISTIYSVNYDTNKLFGMILHNKITFSEQFNDTEHICKTFTDVLSNSVMTGKVKLVKADSNNISDEVSIFIKDGFLLIRIPLLETILSTSVVFSSDKKGVRLREKLDENEMLKTNVTNRYLFKTILMKGMSQEHFVAISMNILSDEAKAKIPSDNENEVDNYPNIDLNDGMERIKLGVTGSGKPIYWNITSESDDYEKNKKILNNRHMLIKGGSGSGKTHFMTMLAAKLHEKGNMVIIFDTSTVCSFDKGELKKHIGDEQYIDNNFTILGSTQEIYKNILDSEKIIITKCTASDAERIIAELLMASSVGNKINKPVFIFLDEILDYAKKIRNDKPIGMAIQQGRKINLNVIAATQHLSGTGSNALKAIFDSSLKIAFNVHEDLRSKIAKEIDRSDSDKYEKQLAELSKGEAFVYGELEQSGVRNIVKIKTIDRYDLKVYLPKPEI